MRLKRRIYVVHHELSLELVEGLRFFALYRGRCGHLQLLLGVLHCVRFLIVQAQLERRKRPILLNCVMIVVARLHAERPRYLSPTWTAFDQCGCSQRRNVVL